MEGGLRGGGTTSRHRRVVRRAVLRQRPSCLCTDRRCGHGAVCHQAATIADHFPFDWRALVSAGERNPFQTKYMRPLCEACHGRYRPVDPARPRKRR
jgi:hypothetical protein